MLFLGNKGKKEKYPQFTALFTISNQRKEDVDDEIKGVG